MAARNDADAGRAVPVEGRHLVPAQAARREPGRRQGARARQGLAWPAAEPEPESWLLDRIDPIGHRHGSPGLYADAPVEVFFDNVKVTGNQ